MTEIHDASSLKTGLIAAIMNAGGSLEVTFEQLGEAAITEKSGEVAIAVERTATGVRYFLGEDTTLAGLRRLRKTINGDS